MKKNEFLTDDLRQKLAGLAKENQKMSEELNILSHELLMKYKATNNSYVLESYGMLVDLSSSFCKMFADLSLFPFQIDQIKGNPKENTKKEIEKTLQKFREQVHRVPTQES